MTLQAVQMCNTKLEETPMLGDLELSMRVLSRNSSFQDSFTQHETGSTSWLCLTAQCQFVCMHAF